MPSVPFGSGYRHCSPRKFRSSRSSPSRPSTGIGEQRNLAAAARRIHHEVRHRVAGRVAAQLRDKLEPLVDARPEMRRAGNRVALIKVIRPHTDLQQAMEEALQRIHVVVDALHEHRLAAERNTGVGKAAARLRHFRRELIGMREMQAHPQRMVTTQHSSQGRRNPHRLHHRLLGADAVNSRCLIARRRDDVLEASSSSDSGSPPKSSTFAKGRRLRDVLDQRAVDVAFLERTLAACPTNRARVQ